MWRPPVPNMTPPDTNQLQTNNARDQRRNLILVEASAVVNDRGWNAAVTPEAAEPSESPETQKTDLN